MTGLREAIGGRGAVPGTDLLFLLATPELDPLAGNLSRWPEAAPGGDGWVRFTIGESGDGSGRQHEARAQVFALPDGYHLLVGRSMRAAELLRDKVILPIALGVILTLTLGTAGASR